MTRSHLLIAVIAAAFAVTAFDAADAKPRRKPQTVRNQVVRNQPIVKISPFSTRETVEFDEDFPRGTIVVKSAEKKLYYTLGDGRAVRYAIAVGKPNFQWSGDLWVSRKAENPGWNPTPRMRRENPSLPKYVGPGPRNPLGPRAMYLGWSEYRIHGTNAPYSIGSAASSGCFRMHNADAVDLFQRVHIGALVHVLR
jgi:lipoprotein-anchoring transpeptidase ErfK/SrfK